MVRGLARACRSIWDDRSRSRLNFVLLVLAYILYLVVGAGIFSAIELPYEEELRRDLRAARRDFVSSHDCVSDERLEELLALTLQANNYGVSVLGNDTDVNWDFVSSLFFTSTVLTTTGYGHAVPLSDEGKAFCILYSILGVPVTLFFLSVAVQRLMVLVSRRPVSYVHRRFGVSLPRVAAVQAVCLVLLMTLVLFIIPAWIFLSMERDWNYLQSLYFCFISLTTIGLGDYVPGETHNKEDNPHRQLYQLAIAVYLLMGLVFMLVVLETCYELPQMKRLRQRFYQEDVRELDGETATIVQHDQLADNFGEPVSVIPSVSAQAASLGRDAAPFSSTAPSCGSAKGQL